MKGTVHVATMGCRVNQFDSAALSRLFADDGYAPAATAEDADLIILNTCTVTQAADKEAFKLVRRFRRASPGAVVVVTGCLAERDPEGVASHAEVDLVIGASGKMKATEIVGSWLDGSVPDKIHRPPWTSDDEIFFVENEGQAGRTRAIVKVQEGCERSCSYCIIPTTRGRERSVPVAKIVAEIARLAALGIPEVVLTGVHIGGYGHDLSPRTDLAGLYAAIDRIEDPIRVRISSLEPMEADRELIDTLARSGRFSPHLHLPLQAGSDQVLRDMNRGYTVEEYRALVGYALEKIPGLVLGSDVIVGFPTEGPEEFEQTARLISELPIAQLHVFPFSPRSGTPAASLEALPHQEVRERSARLRAIGRARRGAVLESFVHDELDVLTLKRRGPSRIDGQTDSGLPVIITDDGTVPTGGWIQATMNEVRDGRLRATV